jgi:hypothetical protein
MKAKHEFKIEKDYWEYMHNIYMIEAMKAVITQNLMYAETDEALERNKPDEVYKRAKEYADYFVEKNKFGNSKKE